MPTRKPSFVSGNAPAAGTETAALADLVAIKPVDILHLRALAERLLAQP